MNLSDPPSEIEIGKALAMVRSPMLSVAPPEEIAALSDVIRRLAFDRDRLAAEKERLLSIHRLRGLQSYEK